MCILLHVTDVKRVMHCVTHVTNMVHMCSIFISVYQTLCYMYKYLTFYVPYCATQVMLIINLLQHHRVTTSMCYTCNKIYKTLFHMCITHVTCCIMLHM